MPDLRLVQSEIPSITPEHLHDVAMAVHGFAYGIEDGDISAVKAVLICIDADGVLDIAAFGQPMLSTEVLGTLELAKAHVVESAMR
jgi:hypothetical protein